MLGRIFGFLNSEGGTPSNPSVTNTNSSDTPAVDPIPVQESKKRPISDLQDTPPISSPPEKLLRPNDDKVHASQLREKLNKELDEIDLTKEIEWEQDFERREFKSLRTFVGLAKNSRPSFYFPKELSFHKIQLQKTCINLSRIINPRSDSEKDVKYGDIEYSSKCLHRLSPKHQSGWLNDEIINHFMKKIPQEKFSVLPSGHLGLLSKYQNDHQKFEKIITTSLGQDWKVSTFLMPLHLGNHWTLLRVDMEKGQVDYYDSLNGQIPNQLSDFLKALSLGMGEKDKVWQTNIKNCPKQINSSDCGVYTCLTAYHLQSSGNYDFHENAFPQSDINFFRLHILNTLAEDIKNNVIDLLSDSESEDCVILD